MPTIITSGCFDIFHEGHAAFLTAAKNLGMRENCLVVFVNTDHSAKLLKAAKRGSKYPIDDLATRMKNVRQYATLTFAFESEYELLAKMKPYQPFILVKGPDYLDKKITGDSIAPVLILDTPEPESVKQMKLAAYSVSNP